MAFAEHPDTFHGLPVYTVAEPGDYQEHAADAVAWRLDCYAADETPFADLWQEFTEAVDTERVRALVLGPWWEEYHAELRPALELILADAGRFPALRALFLADVVSDECEISWLQLTDVTPALEAFPLLEEFWVRGGVSLGLGEEPLALRPVRHDALRVPRFESGGLPAAVVRAVGACELPALEQLDLWLGTSRYGGDCTIADLAGILSGARLPALRRLGVQDSEIQDEMAAAVASAPVVARRESLALSMGALTDTGAEALLGGQPLTHLKRLDLHHHFLSGAMADRARAAFGSAGTAVDLSERRTPHQWRNEEVRYVAVSE